MPGLCISEAHPHELRCTATCRGSFLVQLMVGQSDFKGIGNYYKLEVGTYQDWFVQLST